ncbi:MAG: TonB family protein [Acidobacteriota bacterium]
MKKVILTFIAFLFLLFGLLTAGPDTGNDVLVKMKFYEGMRKDFKKGPSVVSTYFLKPLFVGNISFSSKGTGEAVEIKKIFNLSGIKLMSEAKWGWRSDEKKKEFQVIILNGHEFIIFVSSSPEKPENFKISVAQMALNTEKRKMMKEKKKKILPPKLIAKFDLILPENKSSVFGFEDSNGDPFFLSISRAKGEAVIRKEKGQGKAVSVKDPVLIKKVKPLYPKEAVKKRISGKVVIEAVCDIHGKVSHARVLKGDPLLGKAALKAVSQWIYEPYIIDGKPKQVKFTMVVKFHLDKGKKKAEKIKLLKGKIPPYPETAKKARLSGNVVIDAAVDKNGNISKARILSGNPVLARAALESVRFWKYSLPKVEGNVRNVSVWNVFKFNMDKDTEVDINIKRYYFEDIPDIWPTKGYLTSGFGERRHPLTGKKHFHNGQDIGAKKGTPVIAPASGVVTFAGSKGDWGKLIIIDHGNGYISKYGQLSKILVKKGDKIKKRERIGLVGASGQSTAPHLHWEVHYKGKPVNPVKLIKE